MQFQTRKNADLSTLPFKSSDARERCRVHEALLDHLVVALWWPLCLL